MPKKLKKGLVHIYTGDGKGKTTAAFGLALRAAGAGLKVCIYQFIKGPGFNENKIFGNIGKIKIEQCGRGPFIRTKPTPKDIECASRGFKKVCRIIDSGLYDLVILDEVNVALKIGLIKTSDMLVLIRQKPVFVELVMTGRCCPKSLFRYADVVTEMRKIKHPFDKGVMARKGIEY
ncbi:MAG: cob(I)yrinic acid a,c-diamide adenosyltransferase [Candidatus Omnitrophica bacterium]|nr:cob(I)yrinic acid a,c-diamide adenosyltransferase [Candidatus Omnitrophota bacterium]